MSPWVLFALLAVLAMDADAKLPEPGTPEAPADSRYCGEPARDGNGRIKRSQAVLRQFAKVWACPSTGDNHPSCPGWHIDHVIPLAVGGCDMGHNLQWMPVEIKLCVPSAPGNKDCWEREVYAP